jgi:hypothetical protein
VCDESQKFLSNKIMLDRDVETIRDLISYQRLIALFNALYISPPAVFLKCPKEPDKSLDKHKAVKDQDEHDWYCDYPNENYHGGSGNFFKFEYLP